MGQRLNIIVLAEGAIDIEGKPISSEFVRKVSLIFMQYIDELMTMIVLAYLRTT